MRNLFVVLIGLLALSSASAAVLTGRTISVMDGDTIDILQPGNVKTRIRLAGIDAVEKSQPHGAECKRFLSDQIFGKDVQVEVIDTDRYGRTIGIVTVGNDNVNRAVVATGCAWVYRQYVGNLPPTLQRALDGDEQMARAAKFRLWQDANPMPPWEYRRSNK